MRATLFLALLPGLLHAQTLDRDLLATLEREIPTVVPWPVDDIRIADFEGYGPGVSVAIMDSAMTMADSVTQVREAEKVALEVFHRMEHPEDYQVIIIGWRRDIARNTTFTRSVPLSLDDVRLLAARRDDR